MFNDTSSTTDQVQAMCDHCGNLRLVASRAIYRRRQLRCSVCEIATNHHRIRGAEEQDHCEHLNANRPLHPFDGKAELIRRGWEFILIKLETECEITWVKSSRTRLFLIDQRMAEHDRSYALAWCCAAVDLGYVGSGIDLTAERYAEIDQWAQLLEESLTTTPIAASDPLDWLGEEARQPRTITFRSI